MPLEVQVSLLGRSFFVDLSPDESVLTLHEEIARFASTSIDLPVEYQLLYHNGVQLESHRSLASYGIHSSSSLSLSISPFPVQRSGVSNKGEEKPTRVAKASLLKNAKIKTPSAKIGNTSSARKPRRWRKETTKKYKQLHNFRPFIKFVLKQISPGMTLSAKSQDVMNDFTIHMFQLLMKETCLLIDRVKRTEIKLGDLESALKLVLFHRELSKHAITEGNKAVNIFRERQKKEAQQKKQSAGKKKKSTKSKKKIVFTDAVSATPAASQVTPPKDYFRFPPGHMHKLFVRRCRGFTMSMKGAAFLAAAIEYLNAEILELGSNAAKDDKRKMITPRHLNLAVRNDQELNRLLQHSTISSGGVCPFIHAMLLPRTSNPVHIETPPPLSSTNTQPPPPTTVN